VNWSGNDENDDNDDDDKDNNDCLPTNHSAGNTTRTEVMGSGEQIGLMREGDNAKAEEGS
jgi:hypothetical protein